MSESLALTGMAGVGLGAIFFGGLWWTVRKGVSANQPALWLLACLVGFALSRPSVTWLTRPSGGSQPRPAPEAGHAP